MVGIGHLQGRPKVETIVPPLFRIICEARRADGHRANILAFLHLWSFICRLWHMNTLLDCWSSDRPKTPWEPEPERAPYSSVLTTHHCSPLRPCVGSTTTMAVMYLCHT